MSAFAALTVGAEDDGARLDRWFARHFPAVGRRELYRLLRTGQIRIDGKRARIDARIAAGQALRVPPQIRGAARAPSSAPAPETGAAARDLRARVLYRDDAVVAIDKPAGLAVQGGSGQARHVDGLASALRFGAEQPPRLVHRLDKDTSGVLVLARTAEAARRLAGLFREGRAAKLYWALVAGAPRPAEGEIDARLAKFGAGAGARMACDPSGRRAVTRYRTLDRAGRRAAWLELAPLTGRTHQLRVHCAGLGAPILGDRKYGGDASAGAAPRLCLHARSLRIPGLPPIAAPPPVHFRETVERFGFAPGRDS